MEGRGRCSNQHWRCLEIYILNNLYLYKGVITCYNMKQGTIVIRIYLKDYNRIRKAIPAMKDETVIAYFKRVASALEEFNEVRK